MLWNLALLLVAAPISCAASPSEETVLVEIRQGIESGKASFSHEEFDGLLKKHVRPSDGAVDYSGLKKDLPRLDSYLTKLARADLPTLSRNELLALLINAYNANTMHLILERYPGLKSIKDTKNPWDAEKYIVGGHTLSLDMIEHRLIRPLFKDPRIHFAVNCASVGCPRLWPEAFTGKDLDAQLDRIVREDLANPRYLKVEDGKIFATKILDWYGKDFEEKHKTLAAFLKEYGPEPVKKLIEEKGGDPKIKFLTYDWSLNGQ